MAGLFAPWMSRTHVVNCKLMMIDFGTHISFDLMYMGTTGTAEINC